MAETDAIGVHAKNRELYDFVMRGATKRKKTTNGSN
jgi:hypothetical protein